MEHSIPDVLTLKQCQSILQIGKNLMLYLIHNDEIQAFRVGKQWRIRREDLERFMEGE